MLLASVVRHQKAGSRLSTETGLLAYAVLLPSAVQQRLLVQLVETFGAAEEHSVGYERSQFL